jgi:hypothetical protein
LDVPASQRTKEKTTIARLGKITGPESVQGVVINTVRVIHALVDIEAMEALEAPSVLLQIFMKHLEWMRTKKNVTWAERHDADHPQLGCNLYADLDVIWCKVSAGATDFRNLNQATSSEEIKDLIMCEYEDAVSTSIAALKHMSNLVTRSAPVVEESQIYKALVARNKPKATVTPPTNGGGGKNGGGAKTPTSTTPTQNKGRGREGGGASTTPAQGSAKKARTNDDATSKDKGFIILADPTMDVGKILPSNMTKSSKPCPDFITQGLDCPHDNDNCPKGQHAFTPKGIPKDELHKMASHMNTKGHAWFNKNSMMKCKDHYKVPSDFECVGNKNGVIKKST